MRAVSVGPCDGIPSIELLDFVDSGSLSGSATVSRLEVDAAAAVYEVTRPGDWATLVERYPMDATGTHDGEWRYWGGRPGPWFLPDWERVAEDYAGIHVTIGGYLGSSGRALPISSGYTMLAGWIPDGTLWLTDACTRADALGPGISRSAERSVLATRIPWPDGAQSAPKWVPFTGRVELACPARSAVLR